MIEALFWGILAFAISLVFLSYFARESLYSLVGFGLLFVLGFWILLPGNLQYENGTTVQTNYTYTNATLVQTTETSLLSYSNFNDTSSHFFGFWLGLFGAFGIFLSLVEVKRVFKKDE